MSAVTHHPPSSAPSHNRAADGAAVPSDVSVPVEEVAPQRTQLAPNEAPPPDYYSDNLTSVLSFTRATYPTLMTAEDHGYVDAFMALTRPAQRLLARLLQRKGPVFRGDKLAYREVPDTSAALNELTVAGLLTRNDEFPGDQLLALLTVEELRRSLGGTGSRKAEIVHALLRHSDGRLRGLIARQFQWYAIAQQHVLRKLQLLFFGSVHQDLSAFVLRDLSLMQYEAYALSPQSAAFADASDLACHLRLRRLASHVGRCIECYPDHVPRLAAGWLQQLQHRLPHRANERLRGNVLNRIAQVFERSGRRYLALSMYAASGRHPARERRARLLTKLQQQPAAQSVLKDIVANPWDERERVFAQRFGRRGGGFQPAVYEFTLPDPDMTMRPGAIEAVAIEILQAQGCDAVHWENLTPLALTGLTFWEAVFASLEGAFTNPFQIGPNDLYWEDFAIPRKRWIEPILETTHDQPTRATWEHLEACWHAKFGIANPLISWRGVDTTWCKRFVERLTPEQLTQLLRWCIYNLKSARTGFPDLLVLTPENSVVCVEVKGPNDQLQPHQRGWLERLAQWGIPAHVMKLKA